jgi:hypothetical protein
VAKEEVCFVIHFFMGKYSPPVDIPCELVTVCDGNVMAAQHVHKWCREFDNGQVNVKDEQRSGQHSMTADPVHDIDVQVQADIRVSIAQLELRFNFSRGTIWALFMNVLAAGKFAPGGFLII